jgi:pimeloyl-ACP methyl ester carboxylesterase
MNSKHGRLEREGVGLFYEEVGSGEPALLLVHGWSCDHHNLVRQAEYFAPTHRVISVDLRGHGESDAPQQDYTLEGFADDLAWMCKQLDVSRVVVIGHSMGGAVGLEFASKNQDLVAAVVLLDCGIVLSGDLRSSVEETVKGLLGPQSDAVRRSFIDTLFIPTDDPDQRAAITAGMMRTPKHVVASALTASLTWPSMEEVTAPVLAIVADEFILSPAHFPTGVVRHLSLGQTVGSGHFIQLEVPDQVNAILGRFLKVYV